MTQMHHSDIYTDFRVELNNISKSFGGIKALSDVTFKVKKVQIHALVGENGA